MTSKDLIRKNLFKSPRPFNPHRFPLAFSVLFVHGSWRASTGQASPASVNCWGALRIKFGFQIKATPGDELPTPKSLWELTAPTPFKSAS